MQWTIDPSHTSLEFAVRHMGLSTVRGRFRKLSGAVQVEDGTLRAIEATIDAASIDTAEAQRDDHLRSPDFLHVAKYPVITFRSTTVEARGRGRYLVTGELTLRGEARTVTFDVETTEPVTNPWGNRRAGATASGTLNRKDWGLTWNKVLEFGALLVGEEIHFTLNVEATTPLQVAA
ncbi:MAG: YceI family protein [Armatimonadota bacterium]|nr:YceI family protein [Armatimonadota bacterium]